MATYALANEVSDCRAVLNNRPRAKMDKHGGTFSGITS